MYIYLLLCPRYIGQKPPTTPPTFKLTQLKTEMPEPVVSHVNPFLEVLDRKVLHYVATDNDSSRVYISLVLSSKNKTQLIVWLTKANDERLEGYRLLNIPIIYVGMNYLILYKFVYE